MQGSLERKKSVPLLPPVTPSMSPLLQYLLFPCPSTSHHQWAPAPVPESCLLHDSVSSMPLSVIIDNHHFNHPEELQFAPSRGSQLVPGLQALRLPPASPRCSATTTHRTRRASELRCPRRTASLCSARQAASPAAGMLPLAYKPSCMDSSGSWHSSASVSVRVTKVLLSLSSVGYAVTCVCEYVETLTYTAGQL